MGFAETRTRLPNPVAPNSPKCSNRVASSGLHNEVPVSTLHTCSNREHIMACHLLRRIHSLRLLLQPTVEATSPRRQPRKPPHPIMLCKILAPMKILRWLINFSSHRSKVRSPVLRDRLRRTLLKSSTISSTLFTPTSLRLHRLTSRKFHTSIRSNNGMGTCQAQASFILLLVIRSSHILHNQPQPKSSTNELAWPRQQRRRLVIGAPGIRANVVRGRQKKKVVSWQDSIVSKDLIGAKSLQCLVQAVPLVRYSKTAIKSS